MDEYMKNKIVALVGPSSKLIGTNMGEFIDNHDIVIRMKQSLLVYPFKEELCRDIGKRYDEYIDGRSRGMFLNMLNLVMRCKFRTTGIGKKDLANSHNLGVSKIKVLWRDVDNVPYLLDGDWLVYGFHHIMTVGHWYTDLYCARLDYNASAQKV